MAKNRRMPHADHITLPVPEGTLSGAPVAVGRFRGCALTDREAAGGTATVWLDGSFDVDVDGAVTAVGDPVFITTADGTLTPAAGTGKVLWGVALAVKATGVGLLEVAPIGMAQA